jgi:hypothetical protein
MQITIEKNVPVPTEKAWRKYPLGEMEIGDSFVVPAENRSHAARIANSVRTSAYARGMKVTCLTSDKEVRVWLLARKP